jgi:hypothetical protein
MHKGKAIHYHVYREEQTVPLKTHLSLPVQVLAYQDAQVRSLAVVMKDNEALKILADALEDADCKDVELLDCCRRGGLYEDDVEAVRDYVLHGWTAK